MATMTSQNSGTATPATAMEGGYGHYGEEEIKPYADGAVKSEYTEMGSLGENPPAESGTSV
jgi:hypothetical protein